MEKKEDVKLFIPSDNSFLNKAKEKNWKQMSQNGTAAAFVG